MPQLIFHGKKTVPAALRRDVWRPYFAIHFPETLLGQKAGLQTYQKLREFSMRRQLDPPEDLLVATEADVQRAVKKLANPLDARAKLLQGKVSLRLPREGHLLPKRLRAEKLMDQKATSIADTAFVLNLATKWMNENQ